MTSLVQQRAAQLHVTQLENDDQCLPICIRFPFLSLPLKMTMVMIVREIQLCANTPTNTHTHTLAIEENGYSRPLFALRQEHRGLIQEARC